MAECRWIEPPEACRQIFFSDPEISRLALLHPELNLTSVFGKGASRLFRDPDNSMLPAIDRIGQLAERATEGATAQPLLFHYLGSILYILLHRAAGDQISRRALPEQVSRLLELIEQQYRSGRSAGHYANQLGTTGRRLNRLTVFHTGKTVRSLIEAHLLTQAERMLLETDLLVKTIAYELEFDDPNYFSTFFKRHRQQSPVDYRRRHHFKGNWTGNQR